MAGRLVVSVSGIRADTLPDIIRLADQLDRRGVPLSLLVAPRLKDHYRLIEDPATQKWLRARREHGDAVVLHGYNQAPTRSRRAEFAVLPRYEATLRLQAADFALEQMGLRTRVFAAPRWQASPGAIEALPALGFRVLATMTGVHHLPSAQFERGLVYGIGEGFQAEHWWLRALILRAGRVARKGGFLRLGITGKQLGRPDSVRALHDAVDLALVHGVQPDTYREPDKSVLDVA